MRQISPFVIKKKRVAKYFDPSQPVQTAQGDIGRYFMEMR